MRLYNPGMRKLLCLLPLLITTLLHAQSSQSAMPNDIAILHVSTQLVMLDALVENKKTQTLIGGLDRSNFQLSEDGTPQTITYFSHDELPLSIVFLFDITQSVRPTLKSLAKGALEILTHLKQQDEVAIMVFSSHTELLQDFTTDRVRAAMVIDDASSMTNEEGAFVHESMFEAIEQTKRSTLPDSRRVLVWLTDGTANSENKFTQKIMGRQAPELLHTPSEVVEELRHTGVVVSALIEHSDSTDAMLAKHTLGGASFGDIKHYAELTGGPVLNTSKKDVADRLSDLIDQLRGRYTLGYKPTTKPPGTFSRISLQLTPETFQQHPDLLQQDTTVSTRQGYYR